MSEVNQWSTSAASNNAAPPDGAPENTMTLKQVNNVLRENMRAVKAWQADTDGSLVSTNAGNTYSVVLNRPGITSLYDGLRVSFRVNSTNTGAVTLSANGLSAPARYGGGGEVRSGEWAAGTVVDAVYMSALGYWLVQSNRGESFASLFTTTGDTIYRDAAGAVVRLGVGAAGTAVIGGTVPSYGKISGNHIALAGQVTGSVPFFDGTRWSPFNLGTAGQVLTVNDAGNGLQYRTQRGFIEFGAPVSMTTIAEYEWTGIPSDIKSLTLSVRDLSTATSASVINIIVQLGTASAWIAAGYVGTAVIIGDGAFRFQYDPGFTLLPQSIAAHNYTGRADFIKQGTGWVESHNLASRGLVTAYHGAGHVVVGSDPITRVRLRNTATATFDAGTVQLTGFA